MKKIVTLLLGFSSLYSMAQGPTIEGTYLPVRGTAVKQVWDLNPAADNIAVPHGGQDTIWDYSAWPFNSSYTYKIATFGADTTPYFSYFNSQPDSATHASYLRTPFNDISDSLYSYYIVARNDGLYMVGGRSEKAAPDFSGQSTPGYYITYDTTYKIVNANPAKHGELYAPVNISYSSTPINDTSITVTYGAAYPGFGTPYSIILKQRSIKFFEALGYGTLIMPNNTTYSDVLLARIRVSKKDSVFDAITGQPISNLILSQLGMQNGAESNYYQYAFLRNNTFGSAYLMYMHASDSTANTLINNAWYSLPVDCGSVSGTVYTDESATTTVSQGVNMAYLYREHSNFAKHDILAKDTVDTNGYYEFNDIPYGVYRVAIRADTSVYHRALTTYYGDTTDWIGADAIITFGDSIADGNDIHLQYHPDSTGNNSIEGLLQWNFNFNGDSQMHTQPDYDYDRDNNPIPGIDVVVRKQPGGTAYAAPRTNSSGEFSFSNLPDGEYKLHVDIPGCPHATSYTFCIEGGQVLDSLNYECGTRYLHTVSLIDSTNNGCNNITTAVAANETEAIAALQAYPNPYTSSTTVKINLAQASDVTLEVYNLLGEKVQVLDNGAKQAGVYSYSYTALAINRPAGVYFVRLIANGKTSVLKIVEQ